MSHTRNNSVNSVDASRKTRYRPNKDKRGVKATKFPFNVEQEKILYDYGMDLEENIGDIARNRPLKNNSFNTLWKKKTATEILDRPELSPTLSNAALAASTAPQSQPNVLSTDVPVTAVVTPFHAVEPSLLPL